MADMNSVPVNPVVPTPPVAQVKYAGFWVRFVANTVDSLILAVPNVVVIIAVNLIFIALGFTVQDISARIVAHIATFIVVWTYYVLMTYFAGATVGKMLVGIHVESDSLNKLSFGRVLLRETIGKIVSLVIIFIGYIMAAFTEKKQALHDKLAHSVVVYKNPSKPFGPGLIVGIVIATILPLIAIFGILSSIVLASLSIARSKGQDAQSMSIVNEVRLNIESNYYDATKEAYSYSVAQNCSSGVFSEPDIQQIISGITNKSVCYAEATSYAISTQLNTPGSSYCVDSSGKTGNGVAVDNASQASCQISDSSPY